MRISNLEIRIFPTLCPSCLRGVPYCLSKVANLGSPGGDELRWDKPVFPGDRLSVRATIPETRRSQSGRDCGVVRTFIEVLN